MYNYSVVIPYRDIYDLLLRVCGSIPDREDIQVIIVDNSVVPLPSDKIPVKQHARVDFLTSDPTKGAGHARNVGLAKTEGRWLVFADADDFFTPDAFPIMDSWLESPADMIFFTHQSRNSVTLEPATRHAERNKNVRQFASNPDDKHLEDYLRYQNASPWARMVRRELVEKHNIQFDCVLAANDVMFAVRVGYYANQIAADSRETYCATVRDGSLSYTPSQEIRDCRYAVTVDKYRFFSEHGLERMFPWLTLRVWRVLRQWGFSEFLRYYRLARFYGVNVWKGLIQLVFH